MLTTTDKRYVDNAINRSHKLFQKDTERYLGILMEKNRDDLKLTRELIETRPTRGEMRMIIQEEVAPLRQDINGHEGRISALEIA